MKTEPDVFSWDDLVSSFDQTTTWEGVRNYLARNYMRDSFALGDVVFFYHSSCDSPGIVGTCKVVKIGVPDLSALNTESPYYDEKSSKLGVSRWICVNVKADRKFLHPALLNDLKKREDLSDLALLKQGQRLSVQPVSPTHAQIILSTWG